MSPVDPHHAHAERVQTLLDILDSTPPVEHAACLERICPDTDLRAEVLSLLAAEAESDGFLHRYASGLIPKLEDAPDLCGRRIGAYRLTRLLGQGGMGVVYEAQRIDGGFDQRVALKLLSTALAGTEAKTRFLAERQILAALEHPAIARIVDGGIAEDGTPWFAMECVDGVAIDAYCDHRKLDLRQRLQIFLQVCDAVEHAHRRLVVHRDLKPANVLVTEGGQVKLLDFGIAKLLDAPSAQAMPPTRSMLRLMTPEYASPEQILGQPVTTLCDVYQLGLLLHELLSGHRPYALHNASIGELERAICEQAPLRPSLCFSRARTSEPRGPPGAATIAAVCEARRSSQQRLRRRLRGDLDNIVLKALRKEPERRYGSVDRLAQDVRRHLDGQPVTARPDTLGYRSRKFLQRHALGATAAGIVVLVAAGLVAFHTTRIQSERDLAHTEAVKAEQVSQFLIGLFHGVDPREARSTDLTARELLDRGSAKVDRDLAAQPAIQADMLYVLGRTYLELGVYDSAGELLDRALDLREARLGPTHPDVARVLGDIGLLRYYQGRYDDAVAHLHRAISILEQSPSTDPSDLSAILSTLGRTHRVRAEHGPGLASLERALAIQSQATGADSPAVAEILTELSTLLYEMGRLDRAAELYERALGIQERTLGGDHPMVGTTLMRLAIYRTQQGRLEGVEAMHRRNLAIKEKAYGPTHDEVGTALNNLGNFLHATGRSEEAIAVLQRSVDVHVAAYGSRHSGAAYPLTNLGVVLRETDRLAEARTYLRRSTALIDGSGDSGGFDTLLFFTLVELAQVEAALGNETGLAPVVQRALATWQLNPGSNDPRLASSLLEIGRLLASRHRCAEAVPLLQRAQRMFDEQRKPSDRDGTDLRKLLAGCSAATS